MKSILMMSQNDEKSDLNDAPEFFRGGVVKMFDLMDSKKIRLTSLKNELVRKPPPTASELRREVPVATLQEFLGRDLSTHDILSGLVLTKHELETAITDPDAWEEGCILEVGDALVPQAVRYALQASHNGIWEPSLYQKIPHGDKNKLRAYWNKTILKWLRQKPRSRFLSETEPETDPWYCIRERIDVFQQLAKKIGKSLQTKNSSGGKPDRQSWTQDKLDNAIREYQADRAKSYADMRDAIERGKPGAKKKAQEVFGRNAIFRALNAKASIMVSRSPVWEAIAEDLKFKLNRNRAKGTRHTKRRGKIGLEIAEEKKSAKQEEGVDNTHADHAMGEVEREETCRLIGVLANTGKNDKEKARNKEIACDLLMKLKNDELTDDEVRQKVNDILNSQR